MLGWFWGRTILKKTSVIFPFFLTSGESNPQDDTFEHLDQLEKYVLVNDSQKIIQLLHDANKNKPGNVRLDIVQVCTTRAPKSLSGDTAKLQHGVQVL